ncbi:MAG: hypothetical protein SNJ82_03175 [Gemmataceae bacterium]
MFPLNIRGRLPPLIILSEAVGATAIAPQINIKKFADKYKIVYVTRYQR